ncbi:hypothetical protein Avbf_01674, partial [Armadillidium vulgare]
MKKLLIYVLKRRRCYLISVLKIIPTFLTSL